MKKIVSIIILSSFVSVLFGQDRQLLKNEVLALSAPLKQLGNNEIRFNLATAIAGLPELNYERLLSDNAGVGLSLAVSLENPIDMQTRSIFLPYGRLYFGDKKDAGFFIEANMAVAGQREKSVGIFYDSTTGTYTGRGVDNKAVSFGFGCAAGAKFLARNGYIGELYLGGGRLFGNTIIGGYPRIGFSVGKRF